jgi:hypothetical protein
VRILRDGGGQGSQNRGVVSLLREQQVGDRRATAATREVKSAVG